MTLSDTNKNSNLIDSKFNDVYEEIGPSFLPSDRATLDIGCQFAEIFLKSLENIQLLAELVDVYFFNIFKVYK